ncbi:MAG: hypothetical protein A2286_13280 [Gammaproteobacteria bacterium RIFOXYA12_FULL_61_12]|nr:MAG: hypothetical protein A2286_13280 [Gammaproteobacteria bacterium RIFOXYA12_FULL_61_12]
MTALLALAFSCALSGFVFAAKQKGWPRGEIFEEGGIPTYVTIGCVMLVVGQLLAAATSGHIGWLWILWALLAYFVGGPVVMAILGRWSGMISLVAAPAFTIAGWFGR